MTYVPEVPVLPDGLVSDDEVAAAPEEVSAAAADAPQSVAAISFSTTTLLLLLFLVGGIVMAFTMFTVNHRPAEEFEKQGMAQRIQFATTYWMQHGFFHTGGVSVRQGANHSVVFHKSSTGGRLIGGFLVQKTYAAFTGHYSYRLMGLYNELVVLVLAMLVALLAFRLAVRMGASALHAAVLAVSLEAVFFTFPDNLALYWGTNGREYWLLFTTILLLAEERCVDRRTRALTILQAVCAFLLTYMEYVAGLAFVIAYGIATIAFDDNRATLKRIAVTCLLPALLAIGLHRAQLAYVAAAFPEIERQGSGFFLRTGLDGSTLVYQNHLDIAYNRNWAEGAFPNYQLLFRWKWLFFAGVAAVLTVVAGGLRGKIPRAGMLPFLALLGSYLLTTAVFSQSVVLHPYLYDVMLFTPLMLALFVLGPTMIESLTERRGILAVAVFFLAVWVSMVQVRRYAIQYPQPPEVKVAPAE